MNELLLNNENLPKLRIIAKNFDGREIYDLPDDLSDLPKLEHILEKEGYRYGVMIKNVATREIKTLYDVFASFEQAQDFLREICEEKLFIRTAEGLLEDFFERTSIYIYENELPEVEKFIQLDRWNIIDESIYDDLKYIIDVYNTPGHGGLYDSDGVLCVDIETYYSDKFNYVQIGDNFYSICLVKEKSDDEIYRLF